MQTFESRLFFSSLAEINGYVWMRKVQTPFELCRNIFGIEFANKLETFPLFCLLVYFQLTEPFRISSCKTHFWWSGRRKRKYLTCWIKFHVSLNAHHSPEKQTTKYHIIKVNYKFNIEGGSGSCALDKLFAQSLNTPFRSSLFVHTPSNGILNCQDRIYA